MQTQHDDRLAKRFVFACKWTTWMVCFLTAALSAAEGTVTLQLNEKPDYRPPVPLARGKKYAMPWSATILKMNPVILGWRLEAPDGNGLAYGGISIRTEDPSPPTTVKRNGAWVDIREELRKKNPLQSFVPQFKPLHALAVQIEAQARYIYLEGRTESEEKAYLDQRVAPQRAEFLKKLDALKQSLAKSDGSKDAYAAGQLKYSIGHLDQVAAAFQALESHTDQPKILGLRQARIHLEQAAEALDAEPPARGLSMPAYDAKSGLAIIFGGDHFDYLANDVWVFDFKAIRWQQRHPANAPEPRADHLFEFAGDGKVKMTGGFIYWQRQPQWDSYSSVHAGPGEWWYDVATNTWKGPAGAQTTPGDSRAYRESSSSSYLDGPRPDAAAHAKALKALPANTWVSLEPPMRPWGRDWGTGALDPDRDTLFLYSGGHCVHSGADAVEYHLATNRWDQPQDTEYCSGYYSGGESVPGWSFNRHPWICGHTWNGLGYHPGLKGLVTNGRQGLGGQYHDSNWYFFDPETCAWTRTPTSKAFDIYSTQVRFIPGLGMVTWAGKEFWKLDDQKKTWDPLAVKGAPAGARLDFCGLVYDPKRKRELFISGGTYKAEPPYSGEIGTLSIPSLEMSSFTPQGSEHIRALYMGKENIHSVWIQREIAWHPALDVFLFLSRLPGDYMVGLDAQNNRWIVLKLPGPYAMSQNGTLRYDEKRDLFYAIDSDNGRVFAMCIDPKTVVTKTFEEYLKENPPKGK